MKGQGGSLNLVHCLESRTLSFSEAGLLLQLYVDLTHNTELFRCNVIVCFSEGLSSDA